MYLCIGERASPPAFLVVVFVFVFFLRCYYLLVASGDHSCTFGKGLTLSISSDMTYEGFTWTGDGIRLVYIGCGLRESCDGFEQSLSSSTTVYIGSQRKEQKWEIITMSIFAIWHSGLTTLDTTSTRQCNLNVLSYLSSWWIKPVKVTCSIINCQIHTSLFLFWSDNDALFRSWGLSTMSIFSVLCADLYVSTLSYNPPRRTFDQVLLIKKSHTTS